jgi:hypothetical protein
MTEFRFIAPTMRCVILAILCLISHPADSRAQVIKAWEARYDGPDHDMDMLHDIAVDDRGFVYVTGSSFKQPFGVDCCTIKYSPDGEELWVARYDNQYLSFHTATSIEVDSEGSVYVFGGSRGTGQYYDFLLIRYDTDGNILWTARYDGPGRQQEESADMVLDDFGNIYVAGRSAGQGTGSDYAVIKYDADGNQLWVERFDGPAHSEDWVFAMTLDMESNVYLTGRTIGEGTSYDYTTVKYDPDGNELWAASYNGPANEKDLAFDVTVDIHGNVYVTGQSDGGGTEIDLATVKYDSSGNEVWVRRYDGSAHGDDRGRAVIVDEEGFVYVTGHCLNLGSQDDYVTIKYDSLGNELGVSFYNGPFNQRDDAMDLRLDRRGSLYVAGESTGRPSTGVDCCIIKYGPFERIHWIERYHNEDLEEDHFGAFTFDRKENIYLAASSGSCLSLDFITVKYLQYPFFSRDAELFPLYVPEDYSTIQEAIDHAAHGQEIIVLPGTYVENLDFKGKDVLVRSEEGPEATVIDGSEPAHPDSGSVVVFVHGEGPRTVLEGFTVRGGSGTRTIENRMKGGGVYCGNGSSPSVCGNIIESNIVSGIGSEGGGIACESYSSPVLDRNIVRNNVVEGGERSAGGGISCATHSSPVIRRGIFQANSADFGGGISCGAECAVLIEDNLIEGNSASVAGGGILCGARSRPTIRYNRIERNSASNHGGGVWCAASDETQIVANTITDNIAARGGGAYFFSSQSSFLNNTLSANRATIGGGAICNASSSRPTVMHCILWGDEPTEIHVKSGNPSVTYCDIEGGWAGEGNIDLPPLFLMPQWNDYRLLWESPCIDAGHADSTDQDGTRKDLGARCFDQDVHPTLYLTPKTRVVQRGDSLDVIWTAINWGIDDQTVRAAAYVTLPDGTRRNILTPETFCIPGETTLRIRLHHRVPRRAPVGFYNYMGSIGIPRGHPGGEDTFPFMVRPDPGANR